VLSSAGSSEVRDPYIVVFDGGAIGNPGKGYGSFAVTGPNGFSLQERREYGDNVTNNVAEYRTLIAALERLSERLGDDASSAQVRIRGDSALVINQVNGVWKVKNANLLPLRDEVLRLLSRFDKPVLSWHNRRETVRVLGH
jgi:ribonuclease HI